MGDEYAQWSFIGPHVTSPSISSSPTLPFRRPRSDHDNSGIDNPRIQSEQVILSRLTESPVYLPAEIVPQDASHFQTSSLIILRHFFPIFDEWSNASTVKKLLLIFSTPLYVIFELTIPVVQHLEIEDNFMPAEGFSESESNDAIVVSDFIEKLDKPLHGNASCQRVVIFIQILLCPFTVAYCFELWDIYSIRWASLASLLTGIGCLVILYFANLKKLCFVLSLSGFLISIVQIFKIGIYKGAIEVYFL